MQDTLVAVCVDFLLNDGMECQQMCVAEMCFDVTVYMEKAVWGSIVWQLGSLKEQLQSRMCVVHSVTGSKYCCAHVVQVKTANDHKVYKKQLQNATMFRQY